MEGWNTPWLICQILKSIEMQTTLENIRKTTTKSPRNVFNKKNIIEEGGAS
jgi:hypothetical protein